jgi:hypothetical protein
VAFCKKLLEECHVGTAWFWVFEGRTLSTFMPRSYVRI